MEKLDVSYFKNKKGFHPLFIELKSKFFSYGRLTGTLKIDNASDETKEALSGLLGIDLKREKTLKIPVQKIERALTKTIFKHVTLIEILESYFGEDLKSKKNIQMENEDKRNIYFQLFYDLAKNDISQRWLDAILEKRNFTKLISNYYANDQDALTSILNNVINALNRLPLKDYERLPIFSSITTKNPHYFDIGTDCGRIFVSALQIYLQFEGKDYIPSPTSEEITDILSRFNIMRDDINNDVTVYGLNGYYQNGSSSNILKYANDENAVINLPLREVARLSKVYGVSKKVFVIENSGFYSTLIDKIIEYGLDVTIICSSGQINLATWNLIDKLIASNHSIYYSGDFDPEGILMAYKMKERYPCNVFYWQFDTKSYKLCLSDETILESRLNQISNIKDSTLSPLINLLLSTKKSGFQEMLLDNILSELRN
jgi:uncharacterized protein (TIGR02679 family)